jgi:hypothetical protein
MEVEMVRTPGSRIVAALVLSFIVVALHANTAPGSKIVTAEGKRVESIFDGIQPNWLAREDVVRQLQQRLRARQWRGKLSSTLPGLGERLVEVQCTLCPNTEACSGSFTVLVPLPPGAGCDNPIACPSVNNFTIDFTDPSKQNIGEQNSYCGPSCCVDAETC